MKNPVPRRDALVLLTLGVMASHDDSIAAAKELSDDQSTHDEALHEVKVHRSAIAMQEDESLTGGVYVRTLGYRVAGDGGDATYFILSRKPQPESEPDVATIRLSNDLHAQLLPGVCVNYRMFGAVGDGVNDDGVQIKRAHQFASDHGLPVVQRDGEFWIKQTKEIPITTNVQWGNALFHIDESHNEKRKSRFVIRSRHSPEAIELTAEMKKALLERLQPGVQIIPELASYHNCLVSIADSGDQIGFRAGSRYQGQSWDREELFYVEEDGRILGDIAWEFSDYTTLTARRCDESFLIVDGGGFFLSGDNPSDRASGYYQNGFRIERSRTRIQNQWVGLEPGQRDVSMQPRSGFYSLSSVYQVTLENIRLIPWEQNRSDPQRRVGSGTYGIRGDRMLRCTFRNLTAEGSLLHWGVFGTNLNKDFRIENCRLNRVDVHFHCWNLTIQDSQIGLRGISITGGGDLIIQNTVQHGNTFVNFRRDFGAKWDGNIRIQNCTLVPARESSVAILSSSPSAFEYGYPIGCGRTIDIENFQFDFRNVPESTATAWLMKIASFAKAGEDSRHFFPQQLSARNVTVRGRRQGIRLVHVVDPAHYQLEKDGGYDEVQLTPNCQMNFENIELEQISPSASDDPASTHLRIGDGKGTREYPDDRGIFAHVRITNCHHLSTYLGNSVASMTITDCLIDRFTAMADEPLRGRLSFENCQFAPRVRSATEAIYQLESVLGTYLTHCTVHAPEVDDSIEPGRVDLIDFVQINRRVRFHQLNTTLGNDILKHLKENQVVLQPGFISMLKAHHGLEAEDVPAEAT